MESRLSRNDEVPKAHVRKRYRDSNSASNPRALRASIRRHKYPDASRRRLGTTIATRVMPLRDLIKKRDRLSRANDEHHGSSFVAPQPEVEPLDAPEFVIMRSDTNTQEFISAPTFPKSEPRPPPPPPAAESGPDGHPKRRSFFRRKSSTGSAVSISSVSSSGEPHKENDVPGKSDGRRLSGRIQLGSRTRSASSVNLPQDLPSITDEDDAAGGEGEQSQQRAENREAQWERRATLLAESSGNIAGGAGVTSASSSRPATPPGYDDVKGGAASGGRGLPTSDGRPRKGSVSDPGGDENLQEAIRLHEAGELQQSTTMFGRLADPDGANNALSQVLYGLALR